MGKSSLRRNGSYTTSDLYIESRSSEYPRSTGSPNELLARPTASETREDFLPEDGLRERTPQARLAERGKAARPEKGHCVAIFPREFFFGLSSIVRCP